MTERGEPVADAARALIGVRFRPQGRDPKIGLDCVGLVASALARAGMPVEPRGDYPQRGGNAQRIAAMIDAAGLVRVAPSAAGAGDVLLLETGPAQFHLAVLTEGGFVHAHAGLRRVVETPGRPAWPAVGAWRAGRGEY